MQYKTSRIFTMLTIYSGVARILVEEGRGSIFVVLYMLLEAWAHDDPLV